MSIWVPVWVNFLWMFWVWNNITKLDNFLIIFIWFLPFLFQEDEKFLTELFGLLTDESTEESKRRDLVLFLKEFCNFSQNLQPQGKDTFYKVKFFFIYGTMTLCVTVFVNIIQINKYYKLSIFTRVIIVLSLVSYMFQTLTTLGILSALEITLTSDDPQTKSASIDILTYIVEFNPSFVREYTLQQSSTTDEVRIWDCP